MAIHYLVKVLNIARFIIYAGQLTSAKFGGSLLLTFIVIAWLH